MRAVERSRFREEKSQQRPDLVGHDRGGGDDLRAVEGDRLDAGVGDGIACDRAGGV